MTAASVSKTVCAVTMEDHTKSAIRKDKAEDLTNRTSTPKEKDLEPSDSEDEESIGDWEEDQ